MSQQFGLSEDDFKVEGHCCAITIPVFKTIDETIDFSHNAQAQQYLQQHYGINAQTPLKQNISKPLPIPETLRPSKPMV